MMTSPSIWRKDFLQLWRLYKQQILCFCLGIVCVGGVLYGISTSPTDRLHDVSSLGEREVLSLRRLQSSSPASASSSRSSIDSYPIISPSFTCNTCSNHGQCLLYQCVCADGFHGVRCEKEYPEHVGHMQEYGVLTIDETTWKRQREMEASSSSTFPTPFLEDSSQNLVSMLAWLTSVPPALGRVLEVTSASFSLVAQALIMQPRTVESISLVHPFATLLGKSDTSGVQGGVIKDEKRGASFPLEMIEGEFESFAPPNDVLYDTIFFHSVLPRSQSAFVTLEKLYRLLTPGGTLIFVERTWDRENMDISHMTDADKAHVKINKNLLERFILPLFLPRYTNDESVRFRLGLIGKKEQDQASHVFLFIGQKLLPGQVFSSESGERLPSPYITREDTSLYTGSQPLWNNNFHLIWAGDSGLQQWRLHIIDSIFKHHPEAVVHVYSNSITKDVFQPFLQDGYSVKLHPWNHTEFFAGTPLETRFRLDPDHKNYRAHSSDAFRLACLWKYGGVYMDFDLFLLNSLYGMKNVLPREAYRGMVNGALLISNRPYHPFLAVAMIHFSQMHDPNVWASVGPKLQSAVVGIYEKVSPALIHVRDHPTPSDYYDPEEIMHIYGPSQFYRHPWQDAKNEKFFLPDALREDELQDTLENTYMFHVWAAVAGGRLQSDTNYAHPNSFLGRLIQANCRVLCQQFLKDNDELLQGIVKVGEKPKKNQKKEDKAKSDALEKKF